jgi:ElaB/YqjD/DUF883 family membrane-anchored ribosome-binding protein
MRSDRLQDNLESFRAQLQRKWSKLTQQDVLGIEGDAGTLAATLAKRYSLSVKDAREQADEFLGGMGTSLREAAQAVGDAAGNLWRSGRNQVTEAVSSGAEKVTSLWESGCQKAEKAMSQRPLTSLAIAAGAGAVLMLLLRRR